MSATSRALRFLDATAGEGGMIHAAREIIMDLLELAQGDDAHEPFAPQEGDRAYNCDADDCRLAPHMAKSDNGAYEFRDGRWALNS